MKLKFRQPTATGPLKGAWTWSHSIGNGLRCAHHQNQSKEAKRGKELAFTMRFRQTNVVVFKIDYQRETSAILDALPYLRPQTWMRSKCIRGFITKAGL